jgi:hypothetical protein
MRVLKDIGKVIDLNHITSKPMTIYEDNTGCIAFAKEQRDHQRTKHIDIKYHFVRDMIDKNEIAIEHCPTELMLADVFTKAMPRQRHLELMVALGLQKT